MKITLGSVLCLSACFSLPPSELPVWVFCFLFPSETNFELLVRALCLLVVVFPAFALCLGTFLVVSCCVWVWLFSPTSACLKGNDEEEKKEDGDDHNSGRRADEEGDGVAGDSPVPALALASATILAQDAVVPSVGVVSLPVLPAGEQVLNDLLFGLDPPPAFGDSGALSVAGLPAGDLDLDQVICDLLSGLDNPVPPAGGLGFAPVVSAGGVVSLAPASADAFPAPADGDLWLGLLAADATLGGLFPLAAAAAPDDGGVGSPVLAAAAAPVDDGAVSPALAATAVPPADWGPSPMDIDSDDGDGHILDDPMDIQEDATMTLRRGGWRRVSPLLRHGRRRRVMAVPLGIPAYRFAGPYTVPWYQGSLSRTGRRRNTQTGALVETA